MDGVNFKEFLLRWGLLDKFRKNCGPGVMDDVLENEDPRDFVVSCFRFDDTPEGVDFWELVNVLWINHIEGNE